MATWDEGWLPTGWTRGNPLRVINGEYRDGSMVALETTWLNFSGCLLGLNELPVLVQFHYDERYRVLTWLRWYFDVPNSEQGRTEYAFVAKQIR